MINSLLFNYKGKNLQIIGTESNGYSHLEAIDTILNLDTGKITKITRKQLLEIL